MKEYIEKAALLENLNHAGILSRFVKFKIERFPAADVAEVRHGYWDDSLDGLTPYCSECRCTHRCLIRRPIYCPNCGVRMDKEDKHEVKCAKCGEIKEIICTVDGKPWCEDCFDRAMGWPLHLAKSSEVQNERNPFQS